MIQKKRVLRRVVLCFYYNLRTIISNLQTSGRYYCIAGGMFCLLLLFSLSLYLSLSCMFFFAVNCTFKLVCFIQISALDKSTVIDFPPAPVALCSR